MSEDLTSPASPGLQWTRLSPRLAATAWRDIVGAFSEGRADRRTARLTAAAGRHAAESAALIGEAQHLRWRDAAASASRRERGTEALAAQAVLLLLADLTRQGWFVTLSGETVLVAAPSAAPLPGETASDVKRRQRSALRAMRALQLQDPTVREFLHRHEAPQLVEVDAPLPGGEATPQRLDVAGAPRGAPQKRIEVRGAVLDLVDDGASLAAALSHVAALPIAERLAALRGIVRPVVQVVVPGHRCETTGLPLQDIWHYLRCTWSLEYRPTPGRSLAFLVRNTARPGAPVMGIASIASAVPQLRVRDTWIGWSVEAMTDQLQASPDAWRTWRKILLRTVLEAQTLIRDDDLRAQVASATGTALEERLVAIADEAARRRVEILHGKHGNEPREGLFEGTEEEATAIDWQRESLTPLFVHKRARTLANLLFAVRTLAAAADCSAAALARSPDLRRAVAIGLREVRKVGLASRMLDLNVCGAVPPYGELLGGKLIALTVTSREVIGAIRERYRAQVSVIASSMAGRPVVRDANPCVLTTTSLYGVSASQYNRLKLTVSKATGEDVLIHWVDLGVTSGFGTAHLSRGTVKALRDYSVLRRGYRGVNNQFGEGTSPRMRQVREALEDLGGGSDAVLRHESPRRVYAVELGDGARAALCTNIPHAYEAPGLDAIAAAWRTRWLARRIEHEEVLDRVALQGSRSVQQELADPTDRQIAFAFPATAVIAHQSEVTSSVVGYRDHVARAFCTSASKPAEPHLVAGDARDARGQQLDLWQEPERAPELSRDTNLLSEATRWAEELGLTLDSMNATQEAQFMRSIQDFMTDCLDGLCERAATPLLAAAWSIAVGPQRASSRDWFEALIGGLERLRWPGVDLLQRVVAMRWFERAALHHQDESQLSMLSPLFEACIQGDFAVAEKLRLRAERDLLVREAESAHKSPAVTH